jgi:predicted Zn-dependent protease
VTLLRKNVANTYCLPGGKIVVYTGILPLTENDAGLATVLGHEVAHATAEHVAERIEREHLTEVAAATVAGGVAFTPAQYVRVLALIDAGAALPFSRSQESEADHIGLVYMARAGYDPHQALAFWKQKLRASKEKSHRSSSATTRATPTASSASASGDRKPSAPTSRRDELTASSSYSTVNQRADSGDQRPRARCAERTRSPSVQRLKQGKDAGQAEPAVGEPGYHGRGRGQD